MATTVKKATGSGASASIAAVTSGTVGTYSTFASITSITPPSMSRGTVDVTDMNSYANNDAFKEYLVDFVEPDEMTLEGFVCDTDAGIAIAETAFYAGTEVSIKIVLPTALGKTMTVQGLITSYQPIGDISTDAGIQFSLGITPTCKPTLAASAS